MNMYIQMRTYHVIIKSILIGSIKSIFTFLIYFDTLLPMYKLHHKI